MASIPGIELTSIAAMYLDRLSYRPGRIPETPEIDTLWRHRFVSGTVQHALITDAGREWLSLHPWPPGFPRP